MSKGSKAISGDKKTEKDKPSGNAGEKASGKKTYDKASGKVNDKAAGRAHDKAAAVKAERHGGDYLISMGYAPESGKSSHWFSMLPVLFFTAVIIVITRMAAYKRPMEQFFWSGGSNDLTDFFSYYKMGAILVCAGAALILLLYRIFVQAFCIKRSFAYIPMILYAVFVLLSYLFSDYKMFALWGWNDRFEGTLVLLAYMVMLFYMINTVNSERNVKLLVYCLAAVSALLGLLGLSQALDHDFFRTIIGKKLITPTWFWDQLDNLNFTFQNREIYQTVYNINYVSFYLTLLIPLFGLLFIRSVMLGKGAPLYKKLLWGALFALLVYNLIGSASSGGLMGMAFLVVVAVIVLNRKILLWWKPVAILLVIAVIIGGISYGRWTPELSGAIGGVTGTQQQGMDESSVKHKIDYMETEGNNVILGYQGDQIIFTTYPEDPSMLTVKDSTGADLSLTRENTDNPSFKVEDARFDWISIKPAKDDQDNHYIVIVTDGYEWPFLIGEDGILYRTGTGKLIALHQVPSVGWENNQAFGSGRGYIWSRSIPMMRDTLFLGHGADTYCIYFPHEDYVGKYNADWNINMVVDKPHNMYMGISIGTGVLSLLALLVLYGIYAVQSFLLYRREQFDSYLSYAGVGIFLGVCGFLAAALVNDSSVSTMPMFYGLLGTGISVNMILNKTR
jgi:hypothetical protein